MKQVIYIDNPSKATLKEIRNTYQKIKIEQIEMNWKKITLDSDKVWQPK